jgi:hypothetical protein
MDLFNWYLDKVKMTQQLPIKQYLLFFLGKVFGAFAFGLLLAAYITGVDWATIGWLVLVGSFLIAAPALPRLFSKK